MEPLNNRFGGGAPETIMHPVFWVILLVASVLILCVRERYTIVPLLIGMFAVPMGQVVVVGGVHMMPPRLLILVGCIRLVSARVLSGRRIFWGRITRIDYAVISCAVCAAVAFTLLWMNTAALINRVGVLLDSLGGYCVLRSFIRSRDDVRRVIAVLAWITIGMALCMAAEQLTGANPLWALDGGARLDGTPMGISDVRGDRIRAQGVFVHPLLAGTFGATAVPLLIWLWSEGNRKGIALVGLAASAVMTLASATSTSLAAYAAAVAALCFWPMRRWVHLLRWGAVGMLIALHLWMKAPVWALIARIDFTGSSSSYQRYMLVDNFLRHIGDWWLIGMKAYNEWGFDMWDLCNEFVSAGLTGGAATLVCLVWIFIGGFSALGRAGKIAGDKRQKWLLWCLGTALFSHLVAYFGVAYDSLMDMAWFALLAMVGTEAWESGNSNAGSRMQSMTECAHVNV